MCDEIIAKKSSMFDAVFEIAHTFETTRFTTNEIKTIAILVTETTNRLGSTK